MIKCPDSSVTETEPQCQFFVVRKKRLCRMTVRPGRRYCGEHEPEPKLESGQADTRIPCPNDPKHTCYASKLEKHLAICNARAVPQPAYIVPGVNAPAPAPAPRARRLLSEVPAHLLLGLVQKVNLLYDMASEYEEQDRADSSRRHLRQASSLLWLAEDEGLVQDNTCYVELGAGKGHLSYYAWRAWCAQAARGSRVLLVDRASLRHKRDNKLRGRDQQPPAEAPPQAAQPARGPTRLRADLAHVTLAAVPDVQAARHVVGLAKHLCGVATDYALRCVTSEQLGAKTRGLVLATCCHHRCQREAFCGMELLTEMGITESEMDIMFGIVSWGTCGDGRSRGGRARGQRAGGSQGEDAGGALGEDAGGALGEDAGGALGEDAGGALGEDAGGALGEDAGGALGEDAGGALGEDAGGALGEDAGGALGEDAGGALGEDAGGALGEDAGGALGEDAGGTLGEDVGGTLGEDAGGTLGEDVGDKQRQGEVEEGPPLGHAARRRAGLRAKALLDWARARWLRRRGLRARLVRFVPAHVSPENLAIVAVRD